MHASAAPARPPRGAPRRAVRRSTGAAAFAAAFAAALAGASALAACARPPIAPAAPPAPSPAPAAGAPAGAPAPNGAVAAFNWAPVPVARRLAVEVDAEVVDEADAAAGGVAERVRTVVALADTVTPGAAPGSARAAGVVEAYEVSASARVQGAGAAPPFVPFAYRAYSDAGGVRAEPAPGAPVDLRCTAPGGAAALAALAAVRETLPRVPAGAGPGARWRDTTVSAACAGPVVLVVQTESRYEAAAGGGGALALVRRSTTTLRGQGAAGVRPVAVVGSGSGETRYLLDPARGAVLSAAGEARAALTVTVAGSARRFTQRARTRVDGGATR
jgi:hypothetical protein